MENTPDKINHSLQPLPMQCLGIIEYRRSEAAVELFRNIKLIKMIIKHLLPDNSETKIHANITKIGYHAPIPSNLCALDMFQFGSERQADPGWYNLSHWKSGI